VLVGVRPERIGFGAAGENRIAPELLDIVFQGARVQAHFAGGDGQPILIETSARLPDGLAPGTQVPLSWAVEDTLLFPAGEVA
jgi:putative spermidine/putrescine transport system ATP-binding protein